VRANSIFRKIDKAWVEASAKLLSGAISDASLSARVDSVLTGELGTEIWSLVMLAERLEEVISQVAVSAEPANLAKYTFNLARSFNLFYHRHRILGEEDETRRAVLIAATDITRRQLTSALATLGIAVPERM
jgi:arginyl-tRNA synthetase